MAERLCHVADYYCEEPREKRLVYWFVAGLVAVGVSGFVLFDAMVL